MDKLFIFSCEKCAFYSNHKGVYNRHLTTLKHKKKFNIIDNKENTNELLSIVLNKIMENNEALTKAIINDKNNNTELLKSIIIKHSESSNTNNINTMNHITNNVGTINNNTNVNMMLFLDNYCKDAVSINQFVEGLEIQVEDLLHTKDKGIIQGISNIFINALKDMDIYKRPIHCSDLKRSTIFIKDDETWTKGKQSREKLSTAIKHISQMQLKLIPEWEATYGQDLNKDDMDEQYAKLVKKATTYIEPNSKEEDKIIKSIAKEVALNKKELGLISNENEDDEE